MRFAIARAAAVCVLLVTACLPALSTAAYPDKPIRLIVPYPAGGSTDVVARAIAFHLGDRLKQSIVVENRPGASGMIGTEMVAKSAPDGYTLEFTASDTHSINPHIYRHMLYDAKRDFTPVGLVGYLPLALIVNPSIPAKNIAEFVALAKTKPGQLTYASFGIGSSAHVAMEMLDAYAHIQLLHVPFQGASPAIAAIIGGQVDAMMVPLTLAEPNARAGKVRLLGVAAQHRFPGMENLPTFKDQNMPLSARAWLGIFGPARLPPPVLDQLNRELAAVLKNPAVLETLTKNGLEPQSMTPDEFKHLIDSDYDLWGDVIKNAHIPLN